MDNTEKVLLGALQKISALPDDSKDTSFQYARKTARGDLQRYYEIEADEDHAPPTP